MSACPACMDKPAHEGGPCRLCWRATEIRVAELTAWWAELETTFTRQARINEPGEGRTDNTPKLDDPTTWRRPYHTGASRVARRIRNSAVGWVKVTVEDFGATMPRNTMPAMFTHLAAYLKPIRRHEDAAEFVNDVANWTWRIKAVVDQPSHRAKIHVGPCPLYDDDNEPCSGEVFAVFPFHDTEGAPMMGCDSGHEEHFWEASRWVRAGKEIARRREQIEQQKRWAS